MDQHMDESVNLDGSIGVEYDHNVAHSALETCLVEGECNNTLSQITTSVEFENIEGGHMMMETEGGDYLHNMPIIGGEEEIMSDTSHQTSILLKSHNLEAMDITIINEETQESILSQITHGSPEAEGRLSQGSQEPMFLHGSQESMLSQASQEPMLSQEPQKTMLSPVCQESILSQGFQETSRSQGSQKLMVSYSSQEPMLLQGSKELVLSQGPQETLLSQGSEESIRSSGSQESNGSHESHNSSVLPGSRESQVVQLSQGLQDSILSQISGAGQSLLVSGGRVLPQLMAPTQLQLQLMKTQAPRTSSTIKQIAIAPKPSPSIPIKGAKLAALSGKQFTLAPKPVQLVARKPGSSIVKKIAVGNAGSKTSTVLGSYGPGKQLVLVPSTTGGAQRLKLVQGGSVQYIKTEGKQMLQPQVLSTKKVVTTTATGNKQVMTKVVLQAGDSGTGAGAGQSVLAKVLGSGSGTRFISLQQAQQLGIISCSGAPTGTKLVSMSPSRPTTSYEGRVAKPKQPALATLKSPSKIVPALVPQGAGTKKVASSSPQVVLRTAKEGTSQILKLESTNTEQKSNSLLASVSSLSNIGSRQHFQNIFNTFAAKSIVKVEASQSTEEQATMLTKLSQPGSTPQIHQISVPGKGVQYVRLVSAASSQPQNSTCRSLVTSTSSSSATSNTSSSTTRTVYNIPSTKTLLVPDGQGGTYLQMATSKLPVPPLVRGTSPAINKLTSKPQQKLVRIAPVPLQLSQAITAQSTTKNVYTNSTIAESIETPEEASLPSSEEDNGALAREIEDSKPSLKDLITKAVRQNGTEHLSEQSTLLPDSQPLQSHIEEEEDEEMDQEEEVRRRERIEEGEAQAVEDVQMEEKTTQHVFMLPAYMQRDKELSTIVEVKPDVISQFQNSKEEAELGSIRPRKPCNCTKSQCLKLYCDCFANGEFCNQCNCNNCFNNLENEEERQKAIRSCLDRNPSAFRPKIGKAKNNVGPEAIRRHNKGCNCKRSGCLKNYCECYEAKIACSANCKCVGCRNIEDNLERSRRARPADTNTTQPTTPKAEKRHVRSQTKQPCSFMTSQVIDAVCACLLEAAREGTPTAGAAAQHTIDRDPVHSVLEEFARCIQDIITASCQAHVS